MAIKRPAVGFCQQPNYVALERHYLRSPIVLYTGAGVSHCSDPTYGLASWEDLLERILKADTRTDSVDIRLFRRQTARFKGKPWLVADWVVERMGEAAFKQQLAGVVGKNVPNFTEHHRQLSAKFLARARTLNAVSAFCAQLTGIVRGAKRRTYRVSANPRVSAVLTTNYDAFLEAASSTKFIALTLKPVGAIGSRAGNVDQIPVFHVHGYVPLGRRTAVQRAELEPFVDPVITSEGYRRAWRNCDASCPTVGLHVHYLRHYTALFVGFSFRDEPVRDLLTELNQERKERGDRLFHYALMSRKEEEALGESFFRQVGVKPILLDDFCEIPALLGGLYRRGLAKDFPKGCPELPIVTKRDGKRTGRYEVMPAERYWDDLMRCRNRAVPGPR